MARTALPAATVNIGGGPSAGTVLPANEATNLTGFTGVNFANNGAILLRIVVGASGVGNVTFNFSRTTEGQLPAPFVVAVSNSTTYIFGPFSPSDFNDASGLIQIDKSGTVTGDSAGLYLLPGWRT
jgi:hypothetical protein